MKRRLIFLLSSIFCCAMLFSAADTFVAADTKPATYYVDECVSTLNSGQRNQVSGIWTVAADEGNVGDDSRIVRSGTSESYLQYQVTDQNTIRVTVYERVLSGEVRPIYAKDSSGSSGNGEKQIDNLFFWVYTTDWEHIDTSKVDVEISKGAHGVRWSIITLTYTLSENTSQLRVWLSNGITNNDYQIGKVELYDHSTYTPEQLPPDAEPGSGEQIEPVYYVDDFPMSEEQDGQRLSGWSAAGVDTYNAHIVGDSSRIYKNGAGESYTVHSLINQDIIRVTVYEKVLEGGARPDVTPIKFSILSSGAWTKWEDSGVESNFEPGRYSYPQRWSRYTVTYTLSEPVEYGAVRVVLGSDQYQVGKLEILNSEYHLDEPYMPYSPSDSKDFLFSGWISIGDIGSDSVKDSLEFERQIVQMYESGINTILPSIWGWEGISEEVLLSYNLRLLDVGDKYGMKSYVYHPALVDALKANDSATAESLMAVYKNHSAFLGVFVMDEPTIEQLADFKTASALFKQLLPDKTFYINLFPYETYNANYGNYVDAYFENVSGTKYLSVDYYVLTGTADNPSMKTNYLRNLQILAQKAAEQDADLHTILLTMGHTNYGVVLRHPTSTADLTFQAYAALAYGSKGITWFTYGASGDNPAMLDTDGQKTEVYDMALETAQHIQFFSDEFLKYSWTGTILKDIGVVNPSFTAVNDSLKQTPILTNVTSTQDLVIGTFSSDEGKAFLISNYTDPQANLTAQIGLTFDRNYLVTVYLNGERQQYNVMMLDLNLAAGEGAFITLKATEEATRQYLKDQLSDYAAQKIASGVYSLRGKDFIREIVDEVHLLLDGMTEQAQMQQAYDQARLEIDEVKDAATELSEVRVLYTQQLEDAFNAIDKQDLSAAYIQAIADFKQKISDYFTVSTSGDSMAVLVAGFQSLAESIVADAASDKLSAFVEVSEYLPTGTTELSYTENGILTIFGFKLSALSQIAVSDDNFDTLVYNVIEHIDQVQVSTQELEAYRQQVTDSITQKRDSLNSSDYTEANWGLITDIFSSLLQQAGDAADFAELKEVFDSIDSSYKQIMTIAEQFEAYKQSKKGELNDYSNAKDYNNYSSARWAEIVQIAANGAADIDEAQSVEDVDSIVSLAKADIDAVANLAQEFVEYKTDAAAQMSKFVEDLGEDNYESAEWAAIGEILEEALSDIAGAQDKNAVSTLMEDAQTSISLVKTKAKLLLEYKTEKVKDADSMFGALTKDDYTSGGWIKIQSALSAAKTAINSAQDKAGVDAALDAFEAQIESAEKPSEKKPATSCKSWTNGAYSIIAAVAVAVGACYVRGKKERHG